MALPVDPTEDWFMVTAMKKSGWSLGLECLSVAENHLWLLGSGAHRVFKQ